MNTRNPFHAAAMALLAVLFMAMLSFPAYGGNKALLVGIENYPNSKIKLRGVRDDVEIVKKALTDRGIFAPQEMAILLDQQATKANIVKAFKDWLTAGTRPGDTVFFYYSGHGARLWDPIGDSEDGYAQALQCWDAQFLGPKERRVFRGVQGEALNPKKTRNLLLDHEIHGLLKKLTGRTVIFVCDSCFSGTVYKSVDPFFVQVKAVDQPEGSPGVFEPRVSEEIVLKARRRTSGITGGPLIPGVSLAALMSSGDYEPSGIVSFKRHPTGHHSVMTWFLYHGLMGAAARDGVLTLGELGRFIRDQVKQAGFRQTPEYMFSPEAIASRPIVPLTGAAAVPPSRQFTGTGSVGPSRPSPQPDDVLKPIRIGCSVAASGVSPAEVRQLQSRLSKAVPWVFWTEDSSQVSCRIALERRGNVIGARLFDATGSSWETVTGPNLQALAPALAGNLRAYAIQSNLTALRNHTGRMQFAVQLKVKSPRERADGEVAEGDFIVFETTAKTPGYLYLFNVNSAGVINPLYPTVNAQPEQLQPNQPVLLGANDTFQVKAPFGKDMLFGILSETPAPNLGAFWSSPRIGEAFSESSQAQQQFVDALWSELTSGGKPKGDWTSQMWVIRSFKE